MIAVKSMQKKNVVLKFLLALKLGVSLASIIAPEMARAEMKRRHFSSRKIMLHHAHREDHLIWAKFQSEVGKGEFESNPREWIHKNFFPDHIVELQNGDSISEVRVYEDFDNLIAETDLPKYFLLLASNPSSSSSEKSLDILIYQIEPTCARCIEDVEDIKAMMNSAEMDKNAAVLGRGDQREVFQWEHAAVSEGFSVSGTISPFLESFYLRAIGGFTFGASLLGWLNQPPQGCQMCEGSKKYGAAGCVVTWGVVGLVVMGLTKPLLACGKKAAICIRAVRSAFCPFQQRFVNRASSPIAHLRTPAHFCNEKEK